MHVDNVLISPNMFFPILLFFMNKKFYPNKEKNIPNKSILFHYFIVLRLASIDLFFN